MALRRAIRYHWLKFRRLQGDPRRLAWGMAMGIFIGVTPTMPFHTVAVLTLAPLFRVSMITAFMGVIIMNPVTMVPMYLAAYKVGQLLLYQGRPLIFPEIYNYHTLLDLLWRGGLALQVGGVVIALPSAILSYFLTLWVIQRYRRQKAQKAAGVLPLSQNPPEPAGPEA
jgi:hypothetical protein